MELGPGRWGTRRGAPALHSVTWFADEFERTRPDDYVLAGVEHATLEVVAVHYLCVVGRVGLFVQAEIDQHRPVLELTARVQDAALRADSSGLLPGEGRFVVVQTPFGLHHWELTPMHAGNADGLEGAMAWLDGLAR